MDREIIRSFDGKDISIALWQKVEKPVGVVQIMHGMAEHIERYNDFARFLNKKRMIVVGDDHRGHGRTDEGQLGKAGSGDIFEDTVKDELYITEMIGKRFSLPVVVLGHSYGSFLAQRYMTMQKADAVRGYILSGSADMKGVEVTLGSMVSSMRFKKHKDDEAAFIAKQSFKKYDKKIKMGKNDWLTRDEKEVGKYNTDPFCGYTMSYGFYKYFFEGLKTIQKTKTDLPADTKILIASGSEDMVGGRGKLVKSLYKRYKNAGLSPDLKLYEGARHEILNELNKKEVYNDFLDFIELCVSED